MTEQSDYEIKDIIRRRGGVCILVYIPSIDEDISINQAEESFNRLTEYEVRRQIERAVEKMLYKPPQTALASGEPVDKLTSLKAKLVGKYNVGDVRNSLAGKPVNE